MHCKREQGGSFGRNHPVCSKRVTQKLDDFSLYIRGFIVYGMTILVVDITGTAQLLNDFIRTIYPYCLVSFISNHQYGAFDLFQLHVHIKIQKSFHQNAETGAILCTSDLFQRWKQILYTLQKSRGIHNLKKVSAPPHPAYQPVPTRFSLPSS